MQEVIYLSDRKLSQFLPGLRSVWPRQRVSFSTPFGGVEVDPPPGAGPDLRGRHLTRVVRRIEESARWYAEEGLRPGQWVAFEAPLNYFALESVDPAMVFFADTPARDRTVRLLLHGSAEHLITGLLPRVTDGTPESGELVRDLIGSDASAPGALLAALSDDLGAGANGRRPSLITALRGLLERIDARTHPETAAAMRGYARVTTGFTGGDGPGLIVASPLYVEYD
ncbi:SAVMC3_10250 family protein [Streptomyces griseoflavus]|uniref:SAVMC3_10250 family protein n=1 Tax=Streptomyces griseoflavus TaxID=35619 RepID=UPI00167CF60C|nr:SAVMC3_10250 family protein [Streptomyces griseoflavus]